MPPAVAALHDRELFPFWKAENAIDDSAGSGPLRPAPEGGAVGMCSTGRFRSDHRYDKETYDLAGEK
jgi:hypothetical protein